ncbi:MAG: hypothetical protein HY460_00995 [Parcubacteria group bacterium]|nr:hypothetical protein [Parcubacteria group bacterium]
MNRKQAFTWVGIAVVAVGVLILAKAVGVGATHVSIDENLSVSPSVISYETVFPGEIIPSPITIALSDQFLSSPLHEGVEYRIIQRPKPRTDSESERAYCAENPDDSARCYPSLCPYLGKIADGSPDNDTGVPAFHDPTATSSIAVGRLMKSEDDTSDEWTIELKTPCFRGECDQTVRSDAFVLDPELKGETFGCDLVVEVERVSETACTDDTIFPVGGAVLTDPTPKTIHSYADIGTCDLTTSDDVIIDGHVTYPATCNSAKLRAPAIDVKPGARIDFLREHGELRLEGRVRGTTIRGTVFSSSREPIRVNGFPELFLDGARIENSNRSGDILMRSRANMAIASSTLQIGFTPPLTDDGNTIEIDCASEPCKIEVLNSTLRTRILRLRSEDDLLMRDTTIDGHDPKGDYEFTSKRDMVDIGGGACRDANHIENPREGVLNIKGRGAVTLVDLFVRIPRDIRVTSQKSTIDASAADIANDFGLAGDIFMTANNGKSSITIANAKLVDDNGGSHIFSTLNHADDPLHVSRLLNNVLGIPMIDD